jgi:hypothetical protein
MKWKAPPGTTSTGGVGSDGRAYVISPDENGVAEVPGPASMFAAQMGWIPTGPVTVDAVRCEALPETTRDRESGVVAAGARMVDAIAKAISPPKAVVECLLCDKPIESGEKTTPIVEREGELYFAKKGEEGELAHSVCWKKYNDPKA